MDMDTCSEDSDEDLDATLDIGFRLLSNVSHRKRMRRVGLQLQMQVMVVSWMEDLQK